MAGMFDVFNSPNTSEGQKTINRHFLDWIIMMKVSGVRTNAELQSILETKIERTLTAEELSDLTDMVAYVEAGTGEAGKVARLHRITATVGGWETGVGNLTEAEARSVMGVPFS